MINFSLIYLYIAQPSITSFYEKTEEKTVTVCIFSTLYILHYKNMQSFKVVQQFHQTVFKTRFFNITLSGELGFQTFNHLVIFKQQFWKQNAKKNCSLLSRSSIQYFQKFKLKLPRACCLGLSLARNTRSRPKSGPAKGLQGQDRKTECVRPRTRPRSRPACTR